MEINVLHHHKSGGFGTILVLLLSQVIRKYDINALNNIKKIGITSEIRLHIKDPYIFNHIFEPVNSTPIRVHTDKPDKYINFHYLEESDYLSNLKIAAKKFHIQEELISDINNFAIKYDIGVHTLAVHMRLTDMNTVHGKDHGYVYYKDFLKHIKIFLKKYPIKNIFVSSDNDKSIDKLKVDISDVEIISYKDISRSKTENENLTSNIVHREFNDPDYIKNCMKDIFTMSKCGYLIKRVSGFSNCAIVFSDTLGCIYNICRDKTYIY
jgi:hypothetical protein